MIFSYMAESSAIALRKIVKKYNVTVIAPFHACTAMAKLIAAMISIRSIRSIDLPSLDLAMEKLAMIAKKTYALYSTRRFQIKSFMIEFSRVYGKRKVFKLIPDKSIQYHRSGHEFALKHSFAVKPLMSLLEVGPDIRSHKLRLVDDMTGYFLEESCPIGIFRIQVQILVERVEKKEIAVFSIRGIRSAVCVISSGIRSDYPRRHGSFPNVLDVRWHVPNDPMRPKAIGTDRMRNIGIFYEQCK